MVNKKINMSTFIIKTISNSTNEELATVYYDPSEYSDGSVRVNFSLSELLLLEQSDIQIKIHAFIKDSQSLVALPSITNYIRDFYQAHWNDSLSIHLVLPYFPHARQDRYTGDNAFTLAYSAIPIIKTAAIDSITIHDPHSPVVVDALYKLGIDVNVLSQLDLLRMHQVTEELLLREFDYVVAPDHGAVERNLSMAKELGLEEKGIVTLTKTRDPNTGHLSFETLKTDLSKDSNVVMFDDIGDGCWTHILAAQALKEAGAKRVTLVLTHGILSKGVEHLYPHIDELFVIHDWRSNFLKVNSSSFY